MQSDIAHVYAVSEDKPRAERLIAGLKADRARHYLNLYELALISAGLHLDDQAFEWLNQAFRERSDQMIYLEIDPRLDPIRRDARFRMLVEKVGVPR